MTTINDLQSNLQMFCGTENYYRIYPRLLLTDGVKYLADEAECFWLIDIIRSVSHLLNRDEDEFFVLKLTVNENKSAVVSIDHGTGEDDEIVYSQAIGFSDFPIKEQSLYIQKNEELGLIVMLPSEY